MSDPRLLTITDAAARALGANQRVATMLEDAGLWDRNGSGWHIHDWPEYQKVDATAAERKRRQRDKQRGADDA